MKYILAIILTIGLAMPATACIYEQGLTPEQRKRHCVEGLLETWRADIEYLRMLGVTVGAGTKLSRTELRAMTTAQVARMWAETQGAKIVPEGWLVP